ncbi:MAG TPA: hypothetical protein VEA69_01440 [Tepidisphaeraceae bacterium]|nr:hypothetical protein [Tepidisphaeraceae bacterium]
MICDRCYRPIDQGEHGVYLCPLEPRRDLHFVRPDEIPGGLTIEHGLCNEDGTPRTYYSHSEIKRACEDKGWMRWTDVYSEDKTKDARVRMDWYQSSEAKRAKRWRDEARAEKRLQRERAAAERR